MIERPLLSDLETEGDVENKFVYPLLTDAPHEGLGCPPSSIFSKKNIRKFVIGKGVDQKSYIPDYLVTIAGKPVMVVEAKEPAANIEAAFREARLYAAELNALQKTGVNWTCRVLASNGTRLLAGFPDQAAAHIDGDYGDFNTFSQKLAELHRFLGYAALQELNKSMQSTIGILRYNKPRRYIGGTAVQEEEIGHNSFGATLSADLAHVFNPVTFSDRAAVARDAYVPSRRRDRFVEPIDRVIRAATPFSETSARLVTDTSSPVEVVGAFRSLRPLEHQVLLIVGGAGVGKTTFVDHLQEVALPQDVKKKTVWLHINMNPAPVSANEIYDFLRREIVSKLEQAHPQYDFEDLDQMKRLFAVEVSRFNKGVGKLYKKDEGKYNEKLGEVIENAAGNLHNKAVSLTRYCGSEQGRLIVVVLDNCDKRLRDEQLLMFEAAQWLQKEFRTLVVLPLREETYDNHRSQPPLDTALKDLVFRIEPPLFQNVLVRRVQLALNELAKTAPKSYRYDLPNGFQVQYAASDQAFYLTAIIRSFFEHDRQLRRLILGLSGRNLRDAMELFLEFCKSGYISEAHILRIRRSEGQYTLPLNLVITVLLRSNRRFYDCTKSRLKNICEINIEDEKPSYFTRLMVLRWLLIKFSVNGPSGLTGFFPIREMTAEISKYGINPSVLQREISYLCKAKCAISEDFRTEGLEADSLIKLGPAGFVHLEMLSNPYYWAAVAEDTYFADERVARRIASRIGSVEDQYAESTVLYNSFDAVDYLTRDQQKEAKFFEAMFENCDFNELSSLAAASDGVALFRKSMLKGPWADVLEKYRPATEVTGVVVNAVHYGLFVEVEHGVSGLIHASKLPRGFASMEQFSLGEQLKVRVLSNDPARRRIELEFVELASRQV